jgi:hypothetical protein
MGRKGVLHPARYISDMICINHKTCEGPRLADTRIKGVEDVLTVENDT